VEGGTPGRCGLNTVEAEAGEIERINKRIDGANRIFLANPIVQAFRQKRRLAPVCSLDEPLHDHPPQNHQGNHNHDGLFTHGVIPGSSHTKALGISSPATDEAT